jgi:DNA-binding CsgD family transcriptional regulator
MSLFRKVEYKINPTQLGEAIEPFSFTFLSTDQSVDIDPNPLFYQDKTGTLRGCNKSFEQAVGRSRLEIIGKAAGEIFGIHAADTIMSNFQEVLRSHLTSRFITTLECPPQADHSYLVTMTYSFRHAGEEFVVSSLTDISFISSDRATSLDHATSMLGLTRNPGNGGSPHIELAMCSDTIKNQVVEWLNTLRGHLSDDGKCFLTSIITKLKGEFIDGVDFISERLFDEKHQSLYELLGSQSIHLTRYEMRLCALLSCSYSLTEIARLTRRSPNSINVAFNRIRSKLGISSNDELKYFLATLTKTIPLSIPGQGDLLRTA